MTNVKSWGPQHADIERLIEQVRNLTPDKAAIIMAVHEAHGGAGGGRASAVAWRASSRAGRDAQTARASEDARKAVWEAVWDANWPEVWTLSWIVARAAVAIATRDLVEPEGEYEVADYMALVGIWASGFNEVPNPQEGL